MSGNSQITTLTLGVFGFFNYLNLTPLTVWSRDGHFVSSIDSKSSQSSLLENVLTNIFTNIRIPYTLFLNIMIYSKVTKIEDIMVELFLRKDVAFRAFKIALIVGVILAE